MGGGQSSAQQSIPKSKEELLKIQKQALRGQILLLRFQDPNSKLLDQIRHIQIKQIKSKQPKALALTCPRLRALSILQLTNPGIVQQIADNLKLSHLCLKIKQIPSCLKSIIRMSTLKELKMDSQGSNGFSRLHLKEISQQMPQLQGLVINNLNSFAPDTIESLSNLQNLKMLSLATIPIMTDQILMAIQRHLPHIKQLIICFKKVQNASQLSLFSKLINLSKLGVWCPSKYSKQLIQSLPMNLQQICLQLNQEANKDLYTLNCEQIKTMITRCPKLVKYDFRFQINKQTSNLLITKMKNIQKLTFIRTSYQALVSISFLVPHAHSLKILHFQKQYKVSNSCLKLMGVFLQNLEHLSLSIEFCTYKGTIYLKLLKKLKILELVTSDFSIIYLQKQFLNLSKLQFFSGGYSFGVLEGLEGRLVNLGKDTKSGIQQVTCAWIMDKSNYWFDLYLSDAVIS